MFVLSNKEIKLLENDRYTYIKDRNFYNEAIKATEKDPIRNVELYMSDHPIFRLKAVDDTGLIFLVKSHIRKLKIESASDKNSEYTIPPVMFYVKSFLQLKPSLSMTMILAKSEKEHTTAYWPYGNCYSSESSGFSHICVGNSQTPSFGNILWKLASFEPEKTFFEIDLLPYCMTVYSSFFDSEFNDDLRSTSFRDLIISKQS